MAAADLTPTFPADFPLQVTRFWALDGDKLVLRFEVSSIGKVTSTEIDQDSMHDDEVANCIKGRVLTWRFPAPAGGSVQFSYPFIFQASK